MDAGERVDLALFTRLALRCFCNIWLGFLVTLPLSALNLTRHGYQTVYDPG
jgi:hypothetical protein